MTYYLITDAATQWFSYLVSKEGDELVDVYDFAPLYHVKSTLIDNIYARETFNRGGLDNTTIPRDPRTGGHGYFGGWSISKLEFDRIKRLLELSPAVVEFNKIKDSV